MARGELHIQLAVQYADDEKFEKVSRSSRLLYVDSLCLAKKLLNDGEFSREKARKLMYPESKRAADKAAAELVAAGLWIWDERREMFVIAAWLKRNKSRSQIEQDRQEAEESALRGNHKRWHIGRNEPDAKCRFCAENPNGGPPQGRELGNNEVTNTKSLPNSGGGTYKNLPNSGGPLGNSRGIGAENARSESDTTSYSAWSGVDEPSSPRSGTGSGTRSGGGQRSESTETETETETETKNKEPVPVLHRAHLTPPEPPDSDGTAGPAEQLVTAWVGSCNRRPPSKVVDDVGRHVATMLRDGAPAGDITRGIEIWQAKGMHPNALPSVVNQVMNAQASNVVAIATRGTPRPSTTDQRVGAALALAEKYAQEDPA